MHSKLFVALVVAVVVASLVAAPFPHGRDGSARADTFPTSRDPLKWPFPWDSIWNMPLHADAQYVHASINSGTGYVYTDDDVIIMAPAAPMTDVYNNYADWSGNSRCPAEGPLITRLPIPSSLVIPHEGGTPNMAAAVLQPDGQTIHQSQPFHRCTAGSYATSHYLYPEDNILTGNGIQGAHGGSGMSSLGGTIRMGELVPGGVIRHALKIGVYAQWYLAYNNDGTRGYRWPAVKADSYASTGYGGTNPEMEMGALVALRPDFNVNGLQTEPGRIVARALQDYGAYITDDTAWDATIIMTEWGNGGRVRDEFQSVWGYSFGGSENSNPWLQDLSTICNNLHVVTNNTSTTIGGGPNSDPNRRAPFAPPFAGQATATPLATNTPSPTAAPLPSPWQHGDIGAVGQAGNATYSSGTFTVEGGGADIWGTADEFHYVYQTLAGDGEIVARVASLENTDSWAKAAVMIRDTLNADSKHAMMVVTPGNGTSFQRRPTTGGTSEHTTPGDGVTAPYWVRLVRSGSTLTGYKSSNGSSWTQVGSASISMASSVYVGLAVTAHNDSTLATATFTDVSVTGSGPTPTPVPPTSTPTPTPTGAYPQVPRASTAPVIDGSVDSVWSTAPSYAVANVVQGSVSSPSDLSGSWRALWDTSYLYYLVEITDDALRNDSGSYYWDDDSIDLYIDADNSKSTSYGANDFEYFFRWNDSVVHEVKHGATSGVTFSLVAVSGGYRLEARFPWSTLLVTPVEGNLVGTDVHVNDDDDGGSRDAKKAWFTTVDNSWLDPSLFGTVQLVAGGPAPTATPTHTPGAPTATPTHTSTPTPTRTPTFTPTPASYSESFNDGQAQSWTLSSASVTSQRLRLNNWGGLSQGVYDGRAFSANYTYRVDATTGADSDNNKLRILFNYSNSSNYYYVEVGGSPSNSVTLKKKVGGSVTTLATYGSSYSIHDVWATFEVQYSSGGYITVKATRSGTATTLFNNVHDTSLTSGKIGVQGEWMVADVDNVVVNY